MNVPVITRAAPPVTVRPMVVDTVHFGTLFVVECRICDTWQIVQIGTRPEVTGTSHYCPTADGGQPALVIWK